MEARLKRLRIRCWRRGTKEMDLVLGPFADALAQGRAAIDLDALETLIEENDQDLYAWISGAAPVPERHSQPIETIKKYISENPPLHR